MTAQQQSKIRGGFVWNLTQWVKQKHLAKRTGDLFGAELAQEWINDYRERIARLNATRPDDAEFFVHASENFSQPASDATRKVFTPLQQEVAS